MKKICIYIDEFTNSRMSNLCRGIGFIFCSTEIGGELTSVALPALKISNWILHKKATVFYKFRGKKEFKDIDLIEFQRIYKI